MTELRTVDDKWQELEQAPRGPSAAQLSQYLKQVMHSAATAKLKGVSPVDS